MNTGVLEVLLVNAEGIKHTNLVGIPSYYVIIECGCQSQRSKVSKGKHKKPWWNEKFIFEFSSLDYKNSTHLNCRIMDTKPYRHGGFVGQAKVYIGGLMSEGSKEGHIEIKPAPYNVVLQDDTYRGQIKIGLKFFANKEKYVSVMGKQQEFIAPKKETSSHHSIFGCVMKLWRKISWWKVLLFGNKKSSKDEVNRN